jgi:signal transduction histidine kinase
MSDDSARSQENMFSALENECTEVETFFYGVLNSLYEHVAVVERKGIIITVNDAWRKFASDNGARSPTAVSEGVNYLEVCRRVSNEDEPFARVAQDGIQSVLNGEVKIFTMEYPCHSPTDERWFLMNVVPLRRSEGGAVITHINITRSILAEDKMHHVEQYLRKSREEYRDLSRNLIAAREDARRRLARELHDGFSQRLALISMIAAKFEIEKSDRKSLKAGMKRIQKDISRLSGDIHDIARQLHPQILEDLGLSDAIDSFCSNFSITEGIPVEFTTCNLPNYISFETSLNLYRIVQESLSNSAKHADANRIEVALDIRAGALLLLIRDDGVGFDLETARKKKRLGLVSLKERTALIGGTLSISSTPGSGTEITVEMPLGMNNNDPKKAH